MSRRLILAVVLAAACGPKPPEFEVALGGEGKPWIELRADADNLRFASYDAALKGAAGVRWLDPAAPKAAAGPVARELRAMAPIFSRGRPIALPFDPPTDGWTARAWTYHGRDYLILANLTRDRQWKVPAEALKPYWRPLFEKRRDPRELLKEYKGAYYLRPYQVLVLESRLRPKRFLGR